MMNRRKMVGVCVSTIAAACLTPVMQNSTPEYRIRTFVFDIHGWVVTLEDSSNTVNIDFQLFKNAALEKCPDATNIVISVSKEEESESHPMLNGMRFSKIQDKFAVCKYEKHAEKWKWEWESEHSWGRSC